MTLDTYLNFNGNCRDAFDFYRSVFGGDFTTMQTFRNGPPDMGIAEEDLDQVLHVSLPIGSSVLMGSDMPSNFGPARVFGNNFSISVSPQSKEEADRLFTELSEDGTVTMPIQDVFWGSYFGSLTDKFGINWQINFDREEK